MTSADAVPLVCETVTSKNQHALSLLADIYVMYTHTHIVLSYTNATILYNKLVEVDSIRSKAWTGEIKKLEGKLLALKE